jgi:2-polyprenyl-3-methyl-5-hydroxy-6-metoxy-1,4-benzoquinol methylase
LSSHLEITSLKAFDIWESLQLSLYASPYNSLVACLAMDMAQDEMQNRLRELAPFHHRVDLPYGLSTYVPEAAHRDVERTRVDTLMRHGWPQLLEACGGSLRGRRVLDVACNCGGFSVAAIEAGADYVLGIDIVDRYLDQANFIKEALGHENLEFRNVDVNDLSPETVVGTFDVVLCFGILYHLEDPVGGMRRMADLATHAMLVDTKLMRPKYWGRFIFNRPLWEMQITGASKKKTETTSLWRQGAVCQFTPTERAVLDMLRFLGFTKTTFLPPTEKDLEPRFYSRERGTFLAIR